MRRKRQENVQLKKKTVYLELHLQWSCIKSCITAFAKKNISSELYKLDVIKDGEISGF